LNYNEVPKEKEKTFKRAEYIRELTLRFLSLENRQHLEGTKPLAESGFIKTGGALLNEKPESDDASKFSFYGSTLVCVASSKEEILELLNKDIYARSGVWDMESVSISSVFFLLRLYLHSGGQA
jgi:uncharacterized protein YciI